MSTETTPIRDVVIVGSGPAGLTAAIYAARAQLSPLMLEGETTSNTDQPGGQLMLTTEVENYPGFVEGVLGPELMATFRWQAERFGTEIVTRRATRFDLSRRPFGIWIDDPADPEPSYRARSLIVATGARSLMLGVEGEDRLLGYGVSTCATCDGFFFRDKRIAVVGGGDSAMEEAIFLTRFGRSVTVIHRRKEMRASKIMQDRALRNEKIDFLFDTVVNKVLGEDRLSGVELENIVTGECSVLEVDGLFEAIGHAPNSELLEGWIELDEAGYVRTNDGAKTAIPGLFVCGDLQDHVYRQAVTAAGSGCMAAIDAERFLESEEHAAATAAAG